MSAYVQPPYSTVHRRHRIVCIKLMFGECKNNQCATSLEKQKFVYKRIAVFLRAIDLLSLQEKETKQSQNQQNKSKESLTIVCDDGSRYARKARHLPFPLIAEESTENLKACRFNLNRIIYKNISKLINKNLSILSIIFT